MTPNLTLLLIQVVASLIIVAPILWLVGRLFVGKEKAKLSDALWIVSLGVIINTFAGAYIHGTVGIIVSLIVLLVLIRHFFDCGWGKALLITIVMAVVMIVVAFVVGALIAAYFVFFLTGFKPPLP